MNVILGPPAQASQAQPVASRVSRTGETLMHTRRLGRATVSELAVAMGVARSTVGERLDRLRDHGLIREVDSAVNGRGRPAATFEFNPAAGVILSAHVGMTGVRLGLSDLGATLVTHSMVDVDLARGPDVVMDAVERGLDELLVDAGETADRVHGVGAGLPGSVELSSMPVVGSAPWTSYPIADRLGKRFDAPAYVDQDVNLLALGEQVEAWPEERVLICVKVGSVIGCGIVVDGRIVTGTNGQAGEIGHTRIPGHDALCGCGNRGCLNAVAGGAAIVRQLQDEGVAVEHVRDVVRLAQAGSAPARSAIRQAGRDLGTVLAGAVNLLNPGVIAMWGYLVGDEESLMAGIRETLYQEATPSATYQLQVVSSELGDTTGLRGSALMVTEQVMAPLAIDSRLDRAERQAGSAGG